jgi:hypothetical protein
VGAAVHWGFEQTQKVSEEQMRAQRKQRAALRVAGNARSCQQPFNRCLPV